MICNDYEVYAGLRGINFDGAKFICTLKNFTKEEAEEYAHICAIDEYLAKEGTNDLLSEEDCKIEYFEINNLPDDYILTDKDENKITLAYAEYIETAIEYYVKEVNNE